jgi:hypothetical protein
MTFTLDNFPADRNYCIWIAPCISLWWW